MALAVCGKIVSVRECRRLSVNKQQLIGEIQKLRREEKHDLLQLLADELYVDTGENLDFPREVHVVSPIFAPEAATALQKMLDEAKVKDG